MKRVPIILSITILVISVSGCALLTSLFSPVTALDFDKRPDYAVNKSLHLWKDMKSETIDLKVNFKNKTIKRYDSYTLNSFYNNDGLKNSEFKFYYNNPENLLKTKGNLVSNYSNDYLNLNILTSNDYLLRSFPKNQWIELDTDTETPSKWLNLISYEFLPSQKKDFWNTLKRSNIFITKSSTEGQLHDKEMYIFDVEIDSVGLMNFIIKNTKHYKDFITEESFNQFVEEMLGNIEMNRGKIWVNKTNFITEKILLDIDTINNNEKVNIEIILEINPNFVSLEEIKVDDAVSLEMLIDEYTKTLIQEILPIKKTEESFIKQLEKAVVANSSS